MIEGEKTIPLDDLTKLPQIDWVENGMLNLHENYLDEVSYYAQMLSGMNRYHMEWYEAVAQIEFALDKMRELELQLEDRRKEMIE